MAFLDVPLLHTYRLLHSVNITFIGTENPQAPFKSLSRGGLERNPRYLRGMPTWLVTVTENVTPGQPCGWREGWRCSWRGCCEILPPAHAVCLLPRCARAPVCICTHPPGAVWLLHLPTPGSLGRRAPSHLAALGHTFCLYRVPGKSQHLFSNG